MGYRLSKIYTRKGDDGTTSLDGKNRISKDDIRIETAGTIDELNSAIGLVTTLNNSEINSILQSIQQELFDLGGELCPPHRVAITPEKIVRLEKILDEWNETLPPLKEFLLPGGNPAAAACHVARTICRRAERCLVALNSAENVSPDLLRYVNRLSDVLFVAARMLAKGSGEIMWQHSLA